MRGVQLSATVVPLRLIGRLDRVTHPIVDRQIRFR